jgi:CxxC motif-containing protein (DUF1111 family)
VKGFAGIAGVCAVLSCSIGASLVLHPAQSVFFGNAAAHPTSPVDPGVRTGAAGAGGTYAGLTAAETSNFNAAVLHFSRQWSVTGTVTNMPLPGLGPRYNANACGWCHSQPASGGSSPSSNVEATQMAILAGATDNVVPTGIYAPDGLPYIRANGPTRVSYQPSTNSLLNLYTVVGMSDVTSANGLGGCTSSVLSQPDYSALLASGDIAAHIPTPLFGDGLVESTPGANLIAAQNVPKNTSFGVTSGRFNTGNNGNISTLGWKGASPSVRHFADLAFGAELGASTEIFIRKNNEIPACMSNQVPEDGPKLTSTGDCGGCAMDYQAEGEATAFFVRYLAPPIPACAPMQGSANACYTTASATVTAGSVYNGLQQFIAAGCDTCHVQSQTNGKSRITGQSNVTYFPWSDYALHNMGQGLADGIHQGAAGVQDYKTPALWGIGKRLFFLHDGRTADLEQAILQHCSSGSEAAAVCSAYNALSLSIQQDLLNFLRSL